MIAWGCCKGNSVYRREGVGEQRSDLPLCPPSQLKCQHIPGPPGQVPFRESCTFAHPCPYRCESCFASLLHFLHPPTPLTLFRLPAVGHALVLLRGNVWQTFSKWADTYGSLYRVTVLDQIYICVSDPELIKQVMQKKMDKYVKDGHNYAKFACLLGQGQAPSDPPLPTLPSPRSLSLFSTPRLDLNPRLVSAPRRHRDGRGGEVARAPEADCANAQARDPRGCRHGCSQGHTAAFRGPGQGVRDGGARRHVGAFPPHHPAGAIRICRCHCRLCASVSSLVFLVPS